MVDNVYLIWSLSGGKPFPQKFYDLPINSITGKAYAGSYIKLSADEASMSLDQLAKKYPYKETKE